jgi:hypothetical protein
MTMRLFTNKEKLKKNVAGTAQKTISASSTLGPPYLKFHFGGKI